MTPGRNEQALISAFTRPFRAPPSPQGPGDDAAVLAPTRNELCVTTDAVVQGVHFARGTSLARVGHQALAVNLSDLAAMGAVPRWFVCAVTAPRGFSVAQAGALGKGMARLAREVSISLVGGNFSRGPLALTLTVAGEVPRGEALLRSGGGAGDALYVSGSLGDARLSGWTRLAQPRLALGSLARRHASAGMDISDGLLTDLTRLCAASGVGAVVEAAALPLSGAMRARVSRRPADLAFAWSAGGDYQLLLSVPARRASAFERACARAGERVTRVGTLTRGRGVVLVGSDGRALSSLGRSGFEHF